MARELKKEVNSFIKKNGPVEKEEILEEFDAYCECCGQELEKAEDVKEALRELIHEDREVTSDTEWRYVSLD